MQTPPPVREQYPHRELGIVLLILGILLMVFAVLVGGVCQMVSSGGPYPPAGCYYPYAAGAALMGLIGFVFIIVGIILAVSRTPTTEPVSSVYPPWAHYHPPAPPPPPPAVAQVACRNCGRIHPHGLYAVCPDCGAKLGL